jgi:excisionase family DNA binding protein
MDTITPAALGGESFHEQVQRDVRALALQLDSAFSLDVCFLAYLRRLARFGYFTLGPITIDVNLIEEIVVRTVSRTEPAGLTEDAVRFHDRLAQEMRRSGRRRIDELHYLLAFMRCNEGLPGRVFGELGVMPETVESYLKQTGGAAAAVEPVDRLMSPEEVADYLGVHVQTVRAWIRSGRLPARRVAGLRALRIRYADVVNLLRPLDEQEEEAGEPS